MPNESGSVPGNSTGNWLDLGVPSALMLSLSAHRRKRTRFAGVINPHLLDTNSLGISNGKFDTNHQTALPYYKSSLGLQRMRSVMRRNHAGGVRKVGSARAKTAPSDPGFVSRSRREP